MIGVTVSTAEVRWSLYIRYLTVGGAAFAIYFGLLEVIFSVLQAPYAVAVAVAYAIATGFHFFANRSFTFACRRELRESAPRYVVVLLINYVLQITVLHFMYGIFGVNFYLSAGIGLAATILSGFVLLNRWVFSSIAKSNR